MPRLATILYPENSKPVVTNFVGGYAFIGSPLPLNHNSNIANRIKIIPNNENKIDKIISRLVPLYDYMKSLKADPDIFKNIKNSEWKFISKFFMRENMIYERYGNFDLDNTERKLYRFIKAIEGINYGK